MGMMLPKMTQIYLIKEKILNKAKKILYAEEICMNEDY